MGFYLKRVVSKDTPADVAWRKTYANVLEQVNSEANALYPVVTDVNMKEYVNWRQERLEQLLRKAQ